MILLAEDGGHFDEPERGIAYRIQGKTWVNNHAHVIRARKGIDSDYLCRVLENYDVRQYITGSTRAKLTKGQAEQIELPLPPLDEQQRIAAILDQADALRRKRREGLQTLESLSQACFEDMFGNPITNPKSWRDDLELGVLSEIVSGVTKGRKLDGKVTRTVPYLAVANVQDRRLALENVKHIEATDSEIARYRLEKNDLLLTEGGDPDKLGRGALWNGEIANAIHQNHIFRVRVKSDLVNPMYLSWILGSRRGKIYFLKAAKQTTGIASINMGQLKRFPLLIPPRDLQDRFGDMIQALDVEREAQRRHLTYLDALFASLQHRAFAGEL